MRIIPRFCLLALSAGSALGQALPEFGIEDLRAMAAQRRGRLRALELGFTTYQSPVPGLGEGHEDLARITRRMWVEAGSGRFRLERSIEAQAGEDPRLPPTLFAYDGEIEFTYLPALESGALDVRRRIDLAQEARVLNLLLLNPPSPNGMGIDDGSLESLLRVGVLRAGTEEVAGRTCHVVDGLLDGQRFGTVWLDVERDLLPMRAVTVRFDGSENLAFEASNPLPVVAPNGDLLWIPRGWTSEGRLGQASYATEIEIDMATVRYNPDLPDETFEIQFPIGTTVADHLTQTVYVVPAPGQEIQSIPMSSLPVASGAHQDDGEPAPPGITARREARESSPAPAAGEPPTNAPAPESEPHAEEALRSPLALPTSSPASAPTSIDPARPTPMDAQVEGKRADTPSSSTPAREQAASSKVRWGYLAFGAAAIALAIALYRRKRPPIRTSRPRDGA